MIIGVDLDGVVCDFVGAANTWIVKTYGYDLVVPTEWDWWLQYPDGRMVWRSMWRAIDEGLLRPQHCKAVDGAVAGVQQLVTDHKVLFVTHRPARVAHDTAVWLGRHKLPLNLAFIRDKSLVRADFYVDDKPATVRSLRDAGYDAVLFAQPWNTEAWDELPTVNGWKELLFAINLIGRGIGG